MPEGRSPPRRSCAVRFAALVRAACFDVVWHVFRGPMQGLNKTWTQAGLTLVVSIPLTALLLLIAQGTVSDRVDFGPDAAARAAILSLHAGLELSSFAGTIAVEPGASFLHWTHAVVSCVLIGANAAIHWAVMPSAAQATMLLAGMLVVRMAVQTAIIIRRNASPSCTAWPTHTFVLTICCFAVVSLAVLSLNSPLHISTSVLARGFDSGVGAVLSALGLAAIRAGLRLLLVHCMVAGNLREDSSASAWYRVRKILALFSSLCTSVPVFVVALAQPSHADTYIILAVTWALDVLERGVFIGAYSSPLSASVRTAIHLMNAKGGGTNRGRATVRPASTLAARANANASASVMSIAPALRESVEGSARSERQGASRGGGSGRASAEGVPVIAAASAGGDASRNSPISVVRGLPSDAGLAGVSTGAASPGIHGRSVQGKQRRSSGVMDPPALPVNGERTVHGLSGLLGSQVVDEMPRPEDVATWQPPTRRNFIVVSTHMSAGPESGDGVPSLGTPAARSGGTLAHQSSAVSRVETIDPQDSMPPLPEDDEAGDPSPEDGPRRKSADAPSRALVELRGRVTENASGAGGAGSPAAQPSAEPLPPISGGRSRRKWAHHGRAASTGTDRPSAGEARDLTAADAKAAGPGAGTRGQPIRGVSVRRRGTRNEDAASAGSSSRGTGTSSARSHQGPPPTQQGPPVSPVLGAALTPSKAKLPPLAHAGKVPALPPPLTAALSPDRQPLPAASFARTPNPRSAHIDSSDAKIAVAGSLARASSRHSRRGRRDRERGSAPSPTHSRFDPAHRERAAPAGILRSTSRHPTVESGLGPEGSSRQAMSAGLSGSMIRGDSTRPDRGDTVDATGVVRVSDRELTMLGGSVFSEAQDVTSGTGASMPADIQRLKAMYRSDSVDACLCMISSMYFTQTWLSVIPAFLVMRVLEQTAKVPWLPVESWLELGLRAAAAFVFGLMLEVPGLTIVFGVMRLASGIPNGTTFNPPPEALISSAGDITLIVAYGMVAMSGSLAWAIST